MANYGSAASVKELLGPDGGTWTAEQNNRITALLSLVSREIEHDTGAVFGSSASETREVRGQGDETLFLDKGIRSVTSIVENPTTWTGSAWTGGTTLAATAWRFGPRSVRNLDSAGTQATCYRSLLRVDGSWGGLYVVTGVWEDRVSAVPDEITSIANHVTALLFKTQIASPSASIGPDGSVVPIRNAFREPEVRRALDTWRVGAPLLAV